MTLALFLLILVVLTALAFDFINGFHDCANAVATVVSTGVLPMRTAILLAAVLNFVGALTGTAVASTIGKDVVTHAFLDPSVADAHRLALMQVMVLSGLGGAIFWNLFTWYFGIPSSSSHALIGGIAGAALARGGAEALHAEGLVKIVTSLVVSPVVGFFGGFLTMLLVVWLSRHKKPYKLTRRFRRLQYLSAGFMAFSHGSNDAQKTMGVIAMALVAYGVLEPHGSKLPVPTWVILACAIAMGLGTAAGGIRIIKTMGKKIIDLRPPQGFAAETSAALTILGASTIGAPVSTTHVISTAIMGVGASQSLSSVRWGVTAKIVWAWILTIPISAGVAAMIYLTAHVLMGPAL
ncbi:MAG: inorganic phosphate transporter [Planctomycetes bacterium]|nr:inorganic phosphate transporter [Planctomycetota bacterium]